MEICCIFFSINARSSAVTGTRSTMFLVLFAIRSPSFPFPIRVWDYPNKRCTGRGIFGSVATLPMLAAALLRYLFSYYYGEHPAFFQTDTKSYEKYKKTGWKNPKLCAIITMYIYAQMKKRRTKYQFCKGISLCWLHSNQQTTPVSMNFRKGAEESESQKQ